MNLNTTTAESGLIAKIVERAINTVSAKFDRLNLAITITACHCNGTPLNLERLLAFPEADFNHDITGIIQHINSDTGQLESCFLPRCHK